MADIASSERRRPWRVTVIAWVHIVLGGLSLAVLLFPQPPDEFDVQLSNHPLAGPFIELTRPADFVEYFTIILAGGGLLGLSNLARRLTVIYCYYSCASMVVVTPMYLFFGVLPVLGNRPPVFLGVSIQFWIFAWSITAVCGLNLWFIKFSLRTLRDPKTVALFTGAELNQGIDSAPPSAERIGKLQQAMKPHATSNPYASPRSG